MHRTDQIHWSFLWNKRPDGIIAKINTTIFYCFSTRVEHRINAPRITTVKPNGTQVAVSERLVNYNVAVESLLEHNEATFPLFLRKDIIRLKKVEIVGSWCGNSNCSEPQLIRDPLRSTSAVVSVQSSRKMSPMADNFARAVEDGLRLAKRIYFGKDRSVAPPKPPVSMDKSVSSYLYMPTAPMVYAVISDPAIVDNPDIPSYQPHVHGRCDPPALIPLQMNGITLEVDCYLDTAFLTVTGSWRVHCVMGSRSCDCRIAIPMGEEVCWTKYLELEFFYVYFSVHFSFLLAFVLSSVILVYFVLIWVFIALYSTDQILFSAET